MLPYFNNRYLKLFKLAILCCCLVFIILTYFDVLSEEVAPTRYPPQRIPDYKCPVRQFLKRVPLNSHRLLTKPSNLTESRVLLLMESTYSRHGKLLVQILEALKFPFKAETFSKNIPLLTTATHGRYSIIIIENYYKYLNMPTWNRQLLDKYCIDYKVPLVAFFNSRPNDVYERARIKGSELYLRQNQEVQSLRVMPSPVHSISRVNAERISTSSGWVLFESNKKIECILSATTSIERSLCAVLWDKGKTDGVQRILFGRNVTDWIIKTVFLDSLSFFSNGRAGWGLDRFIQIDIDDVFVGASGTRMVEADVRELLASQARLRRHIDNFTYMLGYSGSYFRHGNSEEDKGDELLIELASNFVWFPHMWRHNHAHEHNGTYLEAAMTQNKLFAKNMRLPVLYPYAIAPQHDGVYPVHEQLFDAWRKVWNVEVTATEEYPHFKPASARKGFVHKNLSVLPRQTCGLYTHTHFFHNYPDGLHKLLSIVEGGELFSTILLNPISIFMTHQQNFAHDRLAIYVFENIVRFLQCWTNLKLRWQDPISSASKYFSLFPNEKVPIWNNPCSDPRHRAILPPSISCANLTLPNVIIVGPQKTGSTALSTFLSLHPSTSTNRLVPGSWEEMQFFGGANYHKGVEWYASHFEPADIVFEKSATYFDNPNAVKQVHALVPEADIVVILYDPAKRAYSWYQHLLAHNDSNALAAGSLEAVLDSSVPSLKKIRQRCISGGRYTHHIDRWLEYFPLSQIHFIDGELLREKPSQVLTELSLELGLSHFDYNKAMLYSPSKGFFCQLIDGKKKCLGSGKGRNYQPMSPELSSRLNEIFQADNLALLRFLTKNKLRIPMWLRRVLQKDEKE